MTRFNEYLITEKFNYNYPLKVVANNKYTWQAHFTVDDTLYKFAADMEEEPSAMEFGTASQEWSVVFFNMSKPGRFGIGNSEITGDKGTSALRVFSGVATALSRFIKDRKPPVFFFSAEERSRVRLYDRLAKMIVKLFRYKYEKDGDGIDSFYVFTI
jgi:hypothetical protein